VYSASVKAEVDINLEGIYRNKKDIRNEKIQKKIQENENRKKSSLLIKKLYQNNTTT
jgi:predicted alpha-1,6-mannanase (GH76 family)